MSNNHEHDDSWRSCPPGTFAKLASEGQLLQRRQFLRRAGGAGGVIGMGMLGAWFVTQERKPQPAAGLPASKRYVGEETYAGITCTKVKEQAELFLDEQLDASVLEQIENHLQLCISCKTYIQYLPDALEQGDA